MYLVSRETDGGSNHTFRKSEEFLEQGEMAQSLKARIESDKVQGKTLALGCNNIDILKSLFQASSVSHLNLKGVRRAVKDEALATAGDQASIEGKIEEITDFSGKVFDTIIELAVFDKASKTVDQLKDLLADKGHYIYIFTLYEETTFKKKILALLIGRYNVEVELLTFKGMDLPVLALVCQKGVEQSGNKNIVMRMGTSLQTIEYMAFLSKVKELYLATMPDLKGVGDLVPGRTIIYDAMDPAEDQIVPYYNIRIIDNKSKTMANQVETYYSEKLCMFHCPLWKGEKFYVQ